MNAVNEITNLAYSIFEESEKETQDEINFQ